MVVTRDGSAWAFLLYSFLVLRLQRAVKPPPGADWCLNFVLDASRVRETYSAPQGFLFAREALTARPISGVSFYRGLLLQAAWMREELPRMFDRWTADGPQADPGAHRAPLWIRIANFGAFPFLATYLHLVTLYRNHRLRTSGHDESCFDTVTRLREYAVATEKFRRLTRAYSAAAKSSAPEAAV